MATKNKKEPVGFTVTCVRDKILYDCWIDSDEEGDAEVCGLIKIDKVSMTYRQYDLKEIPEVWAKKLKKYAIENNCKFNLNNDIGRNEIDEICNWLKMDNQNYLITVWQFDEDCNPTVHHVCEDC